ASSTDTVRVTATDDDGTTGTATDSTTVRLTAVAPQVAAELAVTPASRPEPGGSFTYTVTVHNTGPGSVVVKSMVSDVYGDLNGRHAPRPARPNRDLRLLVHRHLHRQRRRPPGRPGDGHHRRRQRHHGHGSHRPGDGHDHADRCGPDGAGDQGRHAGLGGRTR